MSKTLVATASQLITGSATLVEESTRYSARIDNGPEASDAAAGNNHRLGGKILAIDIEGCAAGDDGGAIASAKGRGATRLQCAGGHHDLAGKGAVTRQRKNAAADVFDGP